MTQQPKKQPPLSLNSLFGALQLLNHPGNQLQQFYQRLSHVRRWQDHWSAARARGERTCLWCGKLLPKKARSTQKYCCRACAKTSWRLSHSDGRARRCIQTKNPGAWRQQLMELTKKTALPAPRDHRILLVCGAMKLTSTDTLVNFIRFELCCDPFDGNTYVFCNSGFSHLKWLRWDGCGFCVGSPQAEWGKYPWPPEKEGLTIEITEQ